VTKALSRALSLYNISTSHTLSIIIVYGYQLASSVVSNLGDN
jgi:hypothetical protein